MQVAFCSSLSEHLARRARIPDHARAGCAASVALETTSPSKSRPLCPESQPSLASSVLQVGDKGLSVIPNPTALSLGTEFVDSRVFHISAQGSHLDLESLPIPVPQERLCLEFDFSANT